MILSTVLMSLLLIPLALTVLPKGVNGLGLELSFANETTPTTQW